MKNPLNPQFMVPGIPASRAGTLHVYGGGTAISAKSATLLLSDGRQMIDFASGGYGYCQQAPVAALRKQLDEMCLSSRAFYNETFACFVEKLVASSPQGLSVTYPCNSGAEAVEGALKLALGFDSRRQTIICTTRAYHGHTVGAHAVSTVRQGESSRPITPFPVEVVAFGNLEGMKQALAQRPAAVILEPIAIHDGFEVCGAKYLQEVRRACDLHGVLLIINEVETAYGMCGHSWYCIASGVVPDILIAGNVLGGGLMSAGVYFAKKHVHDRVYARRDAALHGGTTAGNPASCAVGLSVLEDLDRLGLVAQAAEKGKLLGIKLASIAALCPGEIPQFGQLGLIGGLRFRRAAIAEAVFESCLAEGVALRQVLAREDGHWLLLRPPLCVSETELSTGLSRLAGAVGQLQFQAIAQAVSSNE